MNALVFFLLITSPTIRGAAPEVELMPTKATCETRAATSIRMAWCVPIFQEKK